MTKTKILVPSSLKKSLTRLFLEDKILKQKVFLIIILSIQKYVNSNK